LWLARISLTSTNSSSLSVRLLYLIFAENYCRSSDAELDVTIFKLFDLSNSNNVNLREIRMMLTNLPDLGFCAQTNIELPDRFYSNIRDEICECLEISSL
jgi:Ca2+-binding EF-hand superfamily protein